MELPMSIDKQAVGSYVDEFNRKRELLVPSLPRMVGILPRSENNFSQIEYSTVGLF